MHANREQQRSVGRDVIVCLRFALFVATAFSGWVLVLYVLRGSRPFERLGTTPGAVILFYFTAAILVGPFVGLLLRFARAGPAGAALVGVVTAVPIYAMAGVTVEGFTSWTPGKALFLLLPSILVGVPVGLAYRRMFGGLS